MLGPGGRLLRLDMPTKVAVSEPEGNGIPLEAIRLMMDRLDRANLEETVDGYAGIGTPAAGDRGR